MEQFIKLRGLDEPLYNRRDSSIRTHWKAKDMRGRWKAKAEAFGVMANILWRREVNKLSPVSHELLFVFFTFQGKHVCFSARPQCQSALGNANRPLSPRAAGRIWLLGPSGFWKSPVR